MEISLLQWVLFHTLAMLFWLWLLKCGGAARIEGWAAWALIGWFAGHWRAEQIRLYALVLLSIEIVWFLAGLAIPSLRFST